ncbi:SsrA-binding protein [Bacteroidia bacterium]|nr:SsrA-binding protein [Bacteroidia bacterium]GHT43250.1 SsrA-binding protein [Bacteroidia bacterium]
MLGEVLAAIHQKFIGINNNIVIKNRKASFDYEFIETYVAGIVLTGTEIKSIRLGKASLVDCFCLFVNRELWVRGMYIAEYFYGTYNNHVARSDRKLLLNRKELKKIEELSKNSGYTIIPTKMFLNEKGLVKVVIAVAKGKKLYDKRQSLREKDDRRDMERAFKK